MLARSPVSRKINSARQKPARPHSADYRQRAPVSGRQRSLAHNDRVAVGIFQPAFVALAKTLHYGPLPLPNLDHVDQIGRNSHQSRRRAGPDTPPARSPPSSWSACILVHASAADLLALDHRSPLPRLRQRPRQGIAALSAPNHNRIKLFWTRHKSPNYSSAPQV